MSTGAKTNGDMKDMMKFKGNNLSNINEGNSSVIIYQI
jgi:hypothetical protein